MQEGLFWPKPQIKQTNIPSPLQPYFDTILFLNLHLVPALIIILLGPDTPLNVICGHNMGVHACMMMGSSANVTSAMTLVHYSHPVRW